MARGHEFHYSTLIARDPLAVRLCTERCRRRLKRAGRAHKNNVLALYTHLHFAGQPQVGTALVDAARQSTVRCP